MFTFDQGVDKVCDKLIGCQPKLPVYKHTFTVRNQSCKKGNPQMKFQGPHLKASKTIHDICYLFYIGNKKRTNKVKYAVLFVIN